MKEFRGIAKTCSSRIDGETGSKNIAEHFSTIYSELYNRVELGDDFEELCSSINEQINEDSLKDVDRITEDLIREAMTHIKELQAHARAPSS